MDPFPESADQYGRFASMYDPDYGHRCEDLPFYLELARQTGGPILEIGAGTGRITLPLLKAGFSVLALDSCREMLDGLDEKLATQSGDIRSRARTVHADMRDMDLGETFPLVILPFRTFQHILERRDQLVALRRCRDHLAESPDSRLALSAFHPQMRELVRSPEIVTSNLSRTNPATGNLIKRSHHVEQDFANQISRITFIYEERHPGGRIDRDQREMFFRYMWRSEGKRLLRAGGLRVLNVFGEYDRSPHEFDSYDMIFLCAHD